MLNNRGLETSLMVSSAKGLSLPEQWLAFEQNLCTYCKTPGLKAVFVQTEKTIIEFCGN